MRQLTVLMLALVLAACGGGDGTDGGQPVEDQPPAQDEGPPTQDAGPAQPAAPTAYVTQPSSSGFYQPSPPPDDRNTGRSFTAPMPGTMEAPATEDPSAGLVFDRIVMERTGGPTGEPLTIEVSSDGSAVRNGETFTVTPEQVTELDTLIDEMDFFGVPNTFLGPGGRDDIYTYVVTVYRGGAHRRLDAREGFLPDPLRQLLGAIIQLGN